MSDSPSRENYFVFYGLQPAADIDTALLKQKYLEMSRQFHPDYFAEDLRAQTEAMEITAYNNKAFKTLSGKMDRLRYLVQIMGGADEHKALDPEFLMEMMDLNERLDELGFSDDKDAMASQLKTEIDAQHAAIVQTLESFVNAAQWGAAKDELLKIAYLDRLKTRL